LKAILTASPKVAPAPAHAGFDMPLGEEAR
jgi:hypothetical protein